MLARSGLVHPYSFGLLFAFDGAARDNPGPAASGVCAWWGHFCNGEFNSRGLLVQRGARLGTGTNNIAEAHALASAIKICLQFYYGLVERTISLTRHIDR